MRGEGAGLSWSEGAPMKFIEIGRWEWRVEDASDPVTVRIFKNDELSATGEDVKIAPGEQVEIFPEFPEG